MADARRYRHPALADRVVVRLTPEPLSAADDAEMEVLGFAAPEVVPGVARTRRRALGFPAWALIHDPKHARHALAVVKQLKAQAKVARTKPGSAKDGFDAIATELARTVPHFLPSFLEEAGRAFLEAGSQSQAATMFAKAREAERVHALSVDPTARDRAFLEFALAGAVSGKALSELAQDLLKEEDHADAYTRFRELCIRRTLGGMPPWAGMVRDLRRLSKLAGVEAEAEDEKVVSELLEAPALSHAVGELWTAYGPVISRLAKRSTAIRGALLRILPDPPSERAQAIVEWLALLEECGALEGLIAPRDEIPAEARPPEGAARWLSRLLAHARTWRSEAPDEVFGLIRRMARRLRADGQPVELTGRFGSVDLDVLDVLLEQEVPVADPPGELRIGLDQWVKGRPGSKERPRDPVHAVRDPRFQKWIERAVGQAMRRAGFDAAARTMKGLAEARRNWVQGEIERLGQGSLLTASRALAGLSSAASADTYREMPDAWRALGKVDFASALSRTLRAGTVDELGWPELEAAASELGKAATGPAKLFGSFPYAVLQNGLRAVVVGPRGRVLEHELRIPKGGRLEGLVYAQGQLRVTYRDAKYESFSYWSGSPDDLFEVKDSHFWGAQRVEIELEDGAIVRGGRALSAGDKSASEVGSVLSDGTTFWKTVEGGLRELDPRSGALGRKSLPKFIEDFVAEGKTLSLNECSLFPLPLELEGRTPLGEREGLAGLRVRKTGDGRTEAESIDGRGVLIASGRGSGLVGLVRLPGQEGPLPLVQSFRTLELLEPGGEVVAALSEIGTRSPYAAGTPIFVPGPLWHLLTIRDEQGSHALRRTKDSVARRLIDALRADLAAEKGSAAQGPRALAEQLPEITHPLLATGVLGLAGEAARLEMELEQHRTSCDPEKAPQATVKPLDDAALGTALQSLLGSGRWYGKSEGPFLAAELAAVGAFFGESPPGAPPPLWKRALSALGANKPEEEIKRSPQASKVRWENLVGFTGASAFLATSPLLSEPERAALLSFLDLWAETPFVSSRGFRSCTLEFAAESPYAPVANATAGFLVTRGPNRWFIRPREGQWRPGRDFSALERAAESGGFALLPGATVSAERPAGDDGWTSERLRTFLELVRRRGPRPVEASAVDELARRTGLTRPEAALLWAGLPRLITSEHDFLGKEGREALGLKAAEAKVARDGLQQLKTDLRRELFAAAAAGSADALWAPLGSGPEDDESPVARMAAAWNRRMGQRLAVAPELLVRCKKELPGGTEPSTFLAAVATCERDAAWTRDGAWQLTESGVEAQVPQAAFSGAILLATARYLPFLFGALPVGDPLRARIPDLLRLTRERLAHPGLLLLASRHYLSEESPEREQLLEAVGRAPYPTNGDKKEGRDGGLLVARAGRYRLCLAFRPAQLPRDLDAVPRLLEQGEQFQATRAILSAEYGEMAARVVDTPVPAGGFEANPLLSCPTLVDRVAGNHELSQEAAALYLQILTHLAPTARAVQTWNGWTSARYRKAMAELAQKELIVEAKRTRAGRDHFLPGGWEDLKAPQTPVESWKLPLYSATRSGGGASSPLGVLLPLRPLHLLFEAAFRRIEAGELPGYEEVK